MYLSETSSLPISLNGIEDSDTIEKVMGFHEKLREQLGMDGPTDTLLGDAFKASGLNL